MKTLKIATIAIVSSLFALTSAADINISGDGRYRLGWDSDGDKTQYRNYRMRTTISAGNSANGISVRLDVNDSAGASDRDTQLTDVDGNPILDSDGNNQLTSLDNEKGIVSVDNFNAHVTLGSVKVTAGDVGAGYPGTSGLKFTQSAGDNGDIMFSTNVGDFSAFVRSSAANNASESADTLTYGIGANLAGFQINYANQDNQTKGNSDSLFSAIRVQGNFGGASVDIEQISAEAANSDIMLIRGSAPVAGYTVKFAYGQWDANAGNADDISMVGEGILNGGYGVGAAGNVGSGENTFTGVGLAGSMGSISYNVALGQLDDDNPATSDSMFDLSASYSLDASTTLKFGYGRAQGETGMGFEASYSF